MDFGRESGDEEAAHQLVFDFREMNLSEKDHALCDYAVKLTLKPGHVGEADVQRLQQLGISDESIHVAAQVVSYFNYINRIADGLGVDHESWMSEKISETQWRAEKARDWVSYVSSL